MNKKLKLGLVVVLLLIVVGLAIGYGLMNRQGNVEYTGYYIQYDGTWDRETDDYIFYIDGDEEEVVIFHEDTRTLTKVSADVPFVLHLRTLSGYQFQFPRYDYEPISNHTIYDLYEDEFGNYFIKVTEITDYDLVPTIIYGGEYDNQTT